MKASLRWVLFALVLSTCMALGYGAYTLAGVSWDAVVSYRSPYVTRDLPASSEAAPVSPRTVLVIVDGLRLDSSREMSTLNALREHGADFELRVPQPSLSYPNWTTILAGAPQHITGVVTNWHEGTAPAETIFDTAARAGVRTVFVGPDDFESLYGVESKVVGSFRKKWSEKYLSAEYVDAALSLVERHDPQLVVLHLPDIDEAGHKHGGASRQYDVMAARIDADLRRLVEGLQGSPTTFVVVADHGHIDTGGHGGWEDEVVLVPGILSGEGVRLGQGEALLEDIAPTVAHLTGAPVPRHATGSPISAALADAPELTRFDASRRALEREYSRVVQGGGTVDQVTSTPGAIAQVRSARLRRDREERLPYALGLGLAAVAAVALVGAGSWRALVAAAVGVVAYYIAYNGLFFGVHGYDWSLSAFNSESRIESWMNMRLVEAALSAILASGVAAASYPLLRERPKGPRGEYLAGWLTLGPVTVLVTLATLAVQVAWFLWAWGIIPEWALPDLKWGFKYDLDLIQATAIGFAALLTPVVTYLVGRYHPSVCRGEAEASPLTPMPTEHHASDLPGRSTAEE